MHITFSTISLLNKIHGYLFFRSQLKNSRRLILSPNPLALIEPIVRSISFVTVKKKESDNFHSKNNSVRDYIPICANEIQSIGLVQKGLK